MTTLKILLNSLLVEVDEDLTGVAIEDEAEQELQSALSKAIKVKQKKNRKDPEKVCDVVLYRSLKLRGSASAPFP